MKRGSKIWLATMLSYADRFVAFAFPLLVLKWLGRPDTYAAVEYVLSLSLILATFFDAGLGSYVLYHSRISRNAQLTTTRTQQAYLPIYLLQLIAIAVSVVLCYLAVQPSIELDLIVLGITRACALTVIRLTTQLLILHGRPAVAPLLSLSHWLLSAAAFALPSSANTLSFVTVFFGASILVMVGLSALAWLRRIGPISSQGLTHLRDAFVWGWPILLAAAASMLVMNYSKVYAYSQLPTHEMIGFTFWLRIFSIIQLSHVALMSVLSLQIYESSSPGIIHDNLRRYAGYLAVPAVVSAAIALIAPSIGQDLPRLPLTAMAAIGTYILMWCAGAYLENYLTRDSRNVRVLVSSIIASSVYAGTLMFAPARSAAALATIMCISAATYLALLVHSIKRNI